MGTLGYCSLLNQLTALEDVNRDKFIQRFREWQMDKDNYFVVVLEGEPLTFIFRTLSLFRVPLTQTNAVSTLYFLVCSRTRTTALHAGSLLTFCSCRRFQTEDCWCSFYHDREEDHSQRRKGVYSKRCTSCISL